MDEFEMREDEDEAEQRIANEQGFEDEDEAEQAERILQGMGGRVRRHGGDEDSDEDIDEDLKESEVGVDDGGVGVEELLGAAVDREEGGLGLLDDIGDWKKETPQLPPFAIAWDILSNWITPSTCSLLAGAQFRIRTDTRADPAGEGGGERGICRLEDVVFTTASEPACQVPVMGPMEAARFEQLVSYLNRHLARTLVQLGIAGRDGAAGVATADAKRRISQVTSTFSFARAVQNHTPELWSTITLVIVQAIRLGGQLSTDPSVNLLGGQMGSTDDDGATAQAMADMRLMTALGKTALRADELGFLLRLFAADARETERADGSGGEEKESGVEGKEAVAGVEEKEKEAPLCLSAALAKAGVRPDEIGPDSGFTWEHRTK
jgi:hypothetical protein